LHEVATTLAPASWLNYRKEIERFLIWLRSQQLPQRPSSDWIIWIPRTT
jgi:hypothetical protein